YVEEGFRIRFANGETIDFYAESAALKGEWMTMLSQVVGKAAPVKEEGKEKRWTDLVLARERVQGATSAAGTLNGSLSSSSPSKSSSSSPVKNSPVLGGGTAVHDFTRPPPPQQQQPRPQSERR
ncbi:Bud site selection protein bud4, partial [Teratosphaeriaceae sp. CCFEE 6253]